MENIKENVSLSGKKSRAKIEGENVPVWVNKIQYGDNIKFLPKTKLKKLCPSDIYEKIVIYAGEEFMFAEPHFNQLKETNCEIIGEIESSLNAEELVSIKTEWVTPTKAYEDSEEEKYIPYSLNAISNMTEDEKMEVYNEMISKVDKETFKTFIFLGTGIFPKKDGIDRFLMEWAKAKADFYLMLGRNLTIRQENEYKMDRTEMAGAIDYLANSFPAYAPYLYMISPEKFINNMCCPRECVVGNSRLFERLKTDVRVDNNISVTKLLSTVIKDGDFNVELSKIVQNSKSVKGFLNISIDPYDYFTLSINKHNWTSCVDFGKVSSKNPWGVDNNCRACLAYIIDDATLVSYRDNGKPYNYNIKGKEFVGNSKSWRQLVHINKDTCTAVFNRSYPGGCESEFGRSNCQIVRTLLEDRISEYLERENSWDNYKSLKSVAKYTARSYGYDDTTSREIVVIAPTGQELSAGCVEFAKTPYFCVVCGESVEQNHVCRSH